jgi:hypothetical protein
MKVLIDCQHLQLYSFARPGFHGATETYAKKIAAGLADEGHTVHVVAPDLEDDEQRGERLFYWPPHNHPTRADLVVMVGSLAGAERYEGDGLVYATNGATLPDQLTPEIADLVAAYPVFSKTHAKLLCAMNPGIPKDRCVVTGLGVEIDDYPLDPPKIPGRLLYQNDPARGLWNVLDILEIVQKDYPDASLAVTYDFDRQFEQHRWRQNALAEMMWECHRRMATMPNILNRGALDRAGIVAEQLACQIHVMPSDPNNVGTQIHGHAQLEAAAAGCALVLSDVEAFPELFAGVADILPVPGQYIPDPEGDGRRIDALDYAEIVLDLLRDPEAWTKASKASRKLAERHTWEDVIGSWLLMLDQLDAARREDAA